MYKGPNKIIGATLGGNHYLISNCDYVKIWMNLYNNKFMRVFKTLP